MNDLSEGQRINAIFWPDDAKIMVDPKSGAKEMVVSMQPGQGEMVPWIKVYFKDGRESLVNCALLATVELAPIKAEEV